MNKRFTVITPNYNMGNYLAETIESVLENLKPGDEYFIIDGGSTDNSIEVILRYEKHLTGWMSEKDQGYADALAKGFSRSTSELQCWINCGDLLLSGALELARAKLTSSDADMIFGDDVYIDEDSCVLQISNGQVNDIAKMMLYGGWTPLQDACYWRHSLYEKVGGIAPSLRYAADYDLFLRMSLSGRCQYVPMIFSAFRRHSGQTSIHHAKGYKIEREQCRQHQMSKQNNKSWEEFMLNSYYWLLVRWRAKFQGKKPAQNLIGIHTSNLKCNVI
jgi:glycosyltransferase involved in cell wall biosynthesis